MQAIARESIAIVRQVFPHWSVAIPPSFSETFVEEGEYWHAWDDDRSVSLTSVAIDDAHGPVAAASIVDQVAPPGGTAIEELPPGQLGWAVELDAGPTARASRALCGMLAIDGRLLLATVTSDDREWRRRTWTSIRCLAPPGDATVA